MKKILLALSTLFAVAFVTTTVANAEITGAPTYENIKTQFDQIDPRDAKTSDIMETKVKYNLSEEILTTISTAELAKVIANYPYANDYTAFDEFDYAVKAMKLNFNGYNEFFSREDSANELLNYYMERTSSSLKNRHNQPVDLQINYLEGLLIQPEFVAQFEQSGELESAIQTINMVQDLKSEDSYSTKTYLEIENSEPADNSNATIRSIQPRDNTAYVTTPKGSKVIVITDRKEHSIAKQTLIDNMQTLPKDT